MNKLNGGYIMINAASSTLQADLKTAYETGRPVLYYDATGKAEYATIAKRGDAYYVFKTNDYPKKYVIEITFEDGDIPSNNTVYFVLITKDNLLYMNSEVAEDAQEFFADLGAHSPDVLVQAQPLLSHDVIGGYLTDENTIIITYTDGGAVKYSVLDCGTATTIKTYLM